MSKPLTQIIQAASSGDHAAAADLLPAVYDELRRLARARMSSLPAGQTLQATALVHEAYVRLVDGDEVAFDGRTHFFFAAARAMRDIVVEDWRRKKSLKRGGGRRRLEFDRLRFAIDAPGDDLLALNEALEELERDDPRGYKVVMLRFFAGLTEEETAELLGVTARTVRRDWQFLRVTLQKRLADTDPAGERGDDAGSRRQRTVESRVVEPSSRPGESPSVPNDSAIPVTRALEATAGDQEAASQLLPLAHAELCRLARARMATLLPGQTLQPEALVRETCSRLAGRREPSWSGRGHVICAAAQAMREIIVEQARRKAALKCGGDYDEVDLESAALPIKTRGTDVLACDELLHRLEAKNSRWVKSINLQYYAGLTSEETAAALGVSVATVEREWKYIRAWLRARLAERDDDRQGGRADDE